MPVALAAAGRTARRRAAYEAQLRREALSLAEAAALTGASEGRLRELRDDGQALGVLADGKLVLPRWQLRTDAASPVVPAAQEIARVFPGDLAILNRWMLQPHADLDGHSPAAALQQGRAAEVLAAAQAIGAAGR